MCKNTNNSVSISGTIMSEFIFNHEVYEEKFYETKVAIERNSGTLDIIPILVSEKLFDVTQMITGLNVMVSGEYRSRNNKDENNKSHLTLYVFASEFTIISDCFNDNEINVTGFISKEPVYRRTPRGREVSDLLVAVHRSYGKSDYIPCICWGRNAKLVTKFNVGDSVNIVGRIQSRDYDKRIEDYIITKTAYEVSVSKISLEEQIPLDN